VRNFATGVGVTTFNSSTEIAVFEHAVRDELNRTTPRRLAVLRPLKLVLTNIPDGEDIGCLATNNPQDDVPTTRPIALTREVFIESDDFAEVPPPKFFRLKPGGEVRLKYACIIKLDEVVKDASGGITELRCTAQLDTRSGQPNADKKVKGTIHWVSATDCVDAEVRLYDRLFTVPEPAAEEDFLKVLNPNDDTLTERFAFVLFGVVVVVVQNDFVTVHRAGQLGEGLGQDDKGPPGRSGARRDIGRR
jgi:glutaminyl-tRNA synthetase